MLLVPLLASTFYWQLGSPRFVQLEAEQAEQAEQGPEAMGSVDSMVERLAQRLQQQPDDAEGWYTLGRSYMVMERYPEAAAALERVLALIGDEPGIMLSLADALTLSQGGSMAGRPAELVEKALALAPDSTTALWLGGLAAEERGDYALAAERWRKLEPLLAGQPESQERVRVLIEGAEQALSQ
jgi:cytochrome c-type biogenesis protein CcmH